MASQSRRLIKALHELDEWLTGNRLEIDAKIQRGIGERERGAGISEMRMAESSA